MDDEFLAILQGMEPDKIDAYASRLRGKKNMGDMFGLSFDEGISGLGKRLSGEASKDTKTIGLERSKRAYLTEQMDRADQAREDTQSFQAGEGKLNRAMRRDLARVTEGRFSRQSGKVFDKDVRRLSTDLRKEGIPQMEQSFSRLQETLAPYLSEDGSQITSDVPGMGMTGMLPNFLLSPDGRNVSQDVATIRNAVLKSLSGAAVTDTEAKRLYEQIGQYAGGSDENLVRGMGALKEGMEYLRNSVMAGYDPEIQDVYTRRMAGERVPNPYTGGSGEGSGGINSGPAYLMTGENGQVSPAATSGPAYLMTSEERYKKYGD